ncbi:hypothetical protein GCM10010174_06140 [Kutzneria viridogrisea]|uniref:Uncharacterized protein n=2 Tax=Kutzneria TaxID=43356 RepID=W5WBP8_9PSEU|nr:hypothetical protein [Kutzneria albida]AHH97976.1 hypothetical protein KALB_4614 [Kutzneria albida DSM 43870]MBA8924367.1 hypothetical protein [Kutzneria viridogrisea]
MNLSELGELTAAPGAFASLYLDASHDAEDSAHALGPHWKAAEQELTRQGADPPTLRALHDALTSGPRPVGRAGRALIASAGRVLVDKWLPVPPPLPIARYSELPHLLPLVAQAVPPIPYVVAITDRLGADLRGYGQEGELVGVVSVRGEDHPVHNVGAVAAEVVSMADDLHAELIILAGEVQARTALQEELPQRCQRIAVQVASGGRADGVDEAALQVELATIAQDFARSIQDDLVDRFTEELAAGRGDAVDGLPAVVSALREARAETVVVSQSLVGDRPLWTGDEPGQAALEQEELAATGTTKLRRRRLDEALPCLAAATGAEVVVPDGHVELTDGVGALLRHAQV